MVTNGSKKHPPLSDAFKAVQKDVKLLEKESKENMKNRKQLLTDFRNGLKTQAEIDELDAKLHVRGEEILQAMFVLTQKAFTLK